MEQVLCLEEEIEIAKAEPPIAGKQLMQELLPLMQDYFVGDMRLERGGIVYRMPNGQRFLITAQRV